MTPVSPSSAISRRVGSTRIRLPFSIFGSGRTSTVRPRTPDAQTRMSAATVLPSARCNSPASTLVTFAPNRVCTF